MSSLSSVIAHKRLFLYRTAIIISGDEGKAGFLLEKTIQKALATESEWNGTHAEEWLEKKMRLVWRDMQEDAIRRIMFRPTLSHLETKLISAMEENPGQIVSAAQFGTTNLAMENITSRLRRKGYNVTTIKGLGYMWDGVSK